MMKNTVQVHFLTFKITNICVIYGTIQTGLKCYLSLAKKQLRSNLRVKA